MVLGTGISCFVLIVTCARLLLGVKFTGIPRGRGTHRPSGGNTFTEGATILDLLWHNLVQGLALSMIYNMAWPSLGMAMGFYMTWLETKLLSMVSSDVKIPGK
jgi:hypothetical protein